MTKKILSAVLAVMLVLSLASFAVSADDELAFYVEAGATGNGTEDEPFGTIDEALGASVEWDDATKTGTSVKGDTTVKLTIGKAAITVNGADKALDVPAQIVDSRTLVPVRAIAESFGCEVGWDDATKTVTITK